MKSSTFETKSLHSRNSHVGHSILINRSTQIQDMLDFIDSNVDLMFWIEEISFATWKKSTFELDPSKPNLVPISCAVDVIFLVITNSSQFGQRQLVMKN